MAGDMGGQRRRRAAKGAGQRPCALGAVLRALAYDLQHVHADNLQEYLYKVNKATCGGAVGAEACIKQAVRDVNRF